MVTGLRQRLTLVLTLRLHDMECIVGTKFKR